jgi:hypothetical protein
MSDFEMLTAYWADHPPVHLMVAGYLGVKPRGRKNDDDAAVLAMLGNDPRFRVH